MAMIHPSRGLTPAANASERNWLPGPRRQQSWQNPVIFDLTRDVEEVDGAADIRCGLADAATCGLPGWQGEFRKISRMDVLGSS
jgi:hypothetical protein